MGMHEYDTALKGLLVRSKGRCLEDLTGYSVAQWHNSELPEVRSRFADLLGETRDGELIHIELHSRNDPQIAFRMVEYGLGIYQKFKRMPEQIVLYVGRKPLAMDPKFELKGFAYRCRIVDVRDVDAEPLIASPDLEDNVLAILGRLADEQSAVRSILRRIAAKEEPAREKAMAELTILAGLRDLRDTIKREIKTMPITENILDHNIIGPAIKRGIKRGVKRGIKIGRREGMLEALLAERRIVLAILTQRFGELPPWVNERLETLAPGDLETLAIKSLQATSLEGLFTE